MKLGEGCGTLGEGVCESEFFPMKKQETAMNVEARGQKEETSVAAAIGREVLLQEVARLTPFVNQARFDVFLAESREIPCLMHEIGRLREIAFRAVGEGSGKALDLDRFDEHYLHLILWDREADAVAGGYRLGCTDRILREHGPAGLYTSTLFQLQSPFVDYLTPGLELGRSFVAPDYQRSIHPLGLLWKGIGRFVAENPSYAKLFGPVSISHDYTPISQSLMVKFLRENRRHAELAPYITPYHPFEEEMPEAHEISRNLGSLDEVSVAVASLEPDGKGIPVLLRQYMKLNAKLLEFNVDPDFSNVLDALVLVDLRDTPDEVLARHMGKEGLASFREATQAPVGA